MFYTGATCCQASFPLFPGVAGQTGVAKIESAGSLRPSD